MLDFPLSAKLLRLARFRSATHLVIKCVFRCTRLATVGLIREAITSHHRKSEHWQNKRGRVSPAQTARRIQTVNTTTISGRMTPNPPPTMPNAGTACPDTRTATVTQDPAAVRREKERKDAESPSRLTNYPIWVSITWLYQSVIALGILNMLLVLGLDKLRFFTRFPVNEWILILVLLVIYAVVVAPLGAFTLSRLMTQPSGIKLKRTPPTSGCGPRSSYSLSRASLGLRFGAGSCG